MKPKRVQRWWRAAMVVVPVAAIAASWHCGHLSRFSSAQEAARALHGLGERPMGWAAVTAGVALGAVLFVPINALIAAVTLSFDPLRGFALAMGGSLLGAAAGYGIGYLFGASLVELLPGRRLRQVIEVMQRHAFRTSLLLRLAPLGHFTLLNLLAGSLEVPFWRFMLGTLLGLLPGVGLFTVLGATLPEVLQHPTALSVGLIGTGLLCLLVLGLLVGRWVKRLDREHARP
jgi:uncharacterized membrane protein YdjX (TVP38/TMEM64 family)